MTSPIPDLVVELGVDTLMAYGGATWDWHRLHYDSDFARGRGFAGPVADGQMFGALIARQIRGWAGPRARFVEMQFKNRNVVTAPDTVTIVSRVLATHTIGDGMRLEIGSDIRNAGNRVVVEGAVTVVEVPRA